MASSFLTGALNWWANRPARPPKAPKTPEANPFAIEPALLDTPEAKRARLIGILAAKQRSYWTATVLGWLGWVLKAAVMFVSGVHILQQLSLIKPDNITPLELTAGAYHTSAYAFVGSIDAVALYLLAAASVSYAIGQPIKPSPAKWFLYGLTALLNLTYLITYMPDLPSWVVGYLGELRLATVLMLALLVPVSLAALETAHRGVSRVTLELLVDTTALKEVLGLNKKAAPAPTTAPATPQQPQLPVYSFTEEEKQRIRELAIAGNKRADIFRLFYNTTAAPSGARYQSLAAFLNDEGLA